MVPPREALIAAFRRLYKSLSCCREKRRLVGAVGIEKPIPDRLESDAPRFEARIRVSNRQANLQA
jgi:hypothetical protein